MASNPKTKGTFNSGLCKVGQSWRRLQRRWWWRWRGRVPASVQIPCKNCWCQTSEVKWENVESIDQCAWQKALLDKSFCNFHSQEQVTIFNMEVSYVVRWTVTWTMWRISICHIDSGLSVSSKLCCFFMSFPLSYNSVALNHWEGIKWRVCLQTHETLSMHGHLTTSGFAIGVFGDVIMLPTPSSDRESLGTENFDWMTWGGNGVAIVVYKFWRQVSYFLATYCQLNNGFLLFYLLIHLYGVPHNAKVF